MLFNSFWFLAFVAVAALGYRWLFDRGAAVRIAWLALASAVFYAANDLGHLPLLAASIALNYLMGAAIAKRAGQPAARSWLIAAVAANLGVLVLYKYLSVLAGATGFAAFLPRLSEGPALPLGISFFTFTQIAFLIDCSRGEVKSPKLLDYGVFVAWFPHLVAGPLLPHKRILPQLRGEGVRKPDADDYGVGLTLFILGLFKKVVLADGLSGEANTLLRSLGAGGAHGAAPAWLGSVAFMLVVYFDFSGYSDMAMGVSRLFGIDLPVNFFSPYRAHNPSDFWRRWHRTLSWFIRTYLYSPFAGRKSGWGQYLRLMGIMALVGLWHGSTWNFLLFGLYQGALLCLYNFWRLRLGHRRSRRPARAVAIAAQGANFVAMMASAGLFYFHDFGQCVRFYANAGGAFGLGSVAFPPASSLLLLIELGVVWLAPNSVELVRGRLPRWVMQQLPADKAAVPLVWSPSLRWALALGLAAAVAIASIPHTADFVYNVF